MSQGRLACRAVAASETRRARRRAGLSAGPAPVWHAPCGATPSVLLPLPESLVQEARMYELLAAQARIAELEAALDEARALAMRDPLTGLLNRRGLDEAFARESERAGRSGAALTLALLDVDDFKRINDCHGHAAGDRALLLLARALEGSVRATDGLCRLGGEEFVLLLPDAGIVAAQALLARLRDALASEPVAADCILSFSAGIAAWSPGMSLSGLLAAADGAVYQAKAAGKRCTVTA